MENYQITEKKDEFEVTKYPKDFDELYIVCVKGFETGTEYTYKNLSNLWK